MGMERVIVFGLSEIRMVQTTIDVLSSLSLGRV